jgi:Na+/serine symporter
MHVLTDGPWLSIALWALLYVSDYAFTIACARMYHAGVRDILVFEGSFELTPFFQKDVDALRTLSPRFVLALLWGIAMLALLWWLSRDSWPEVYDFALGALVLVQLAVHVRHVRNFVLFRKTLAGRGVQGRVEYARPLMLQLSALELACFAIVYLVGSSRRGVRSCLVARPAVW